MDSDKAIQLQHQIRENNEDLQSFLRELNNWESEIKRKDEELKSQKRSETELLKDLPPVRTKISKPKTKKKKKEVKTSENENSAEQKPVRISSFDYNAWNKFDVEKVLKDMDQNSNVKSDSENSEEEEILQIQRQKQKAFLDKEKGNEYFKEGKYDEAIACYTLGIQSDPYNAVLLANRAMAFLKKG
ncbi:RNA polymerase II-associated protein 3-like, partial [Limulus polyphemus]|uniref:RNA polymerase II-associated protein 3-like n=1 Tax=Limulus polyphemus TaxID=6850 RepID=A0ABM1BRK5_LIMPO